MKNTKLTKKGQGLPMNVIIIAALALLVLVIIAVILTGRVKIFGSGIRNCRSQGGECSPTQCKAHQTTLPGTECEQYCCVNVYDE